MMVFLQQCTPADVAPGGVEPGSSLWHSGHAGLTLYQREPGFGVSGGPWYTLWWCEDKRDVGVVPWKVK